MNRKTDLSLANKMKSRMSHISESEDEEDSSSSDGDDERVSSSPSGDSDNSYNVHGNGRRAEPHPVEIEKLDSNPSFMGKMQRKEKDKS